MTTLHGVSRDMTRNLRAALVQEQKDRGLVDSKMANILGIERSYWTHIKLGRVLPPKLAPRVIQAFPTLLHAHLLDLQGDTQKVGAA